MKVSSFIKFHFCTSSPIKGNPRNNSIHDLLNESNLDSKFCGVFTEHKYVVMNISQKTGGIKETVQFSLHSFFFVTLLT
jgi:hypothetical protein